MQTINAGGRSPFVLACDHASNRVPARYAGLGLSERQRLMHIAWDPGAFAVSLRLSEALDAPLVASTVSRLVVDCNRDAAAHDLIPVLSERTEIPGNAAITDAERQHRITAYHEPFHQALDGLLEARRSRGEPTILVTVHSFTPVFKEKPRPWPIGLIHGENPRFTAAFRDALAAADPSLNIGWNEPYSGRSGVTYTLEHHGDGRGLDSIMLEIRNDEILEHDQIARWAGLIEAALVTARETLLQPA
ncbi:N-formylglutamate amidohydrolase [Devosia sp.]|uniref:N-formylglutamate amidohydrolase n=1 Tax=Devosia sp. TaxID=1871048 RepID=UPI003A8FBB57